MSIKTYGLDTFRNAIEQNFKLAEDTELYLRKSTKWEVISPATLAIINFRYNPLDANLEKEEIDKLNQYISDKVMESREAMLVTTLLNKQVVLRMCLINPRTTLENDVKVTIDMCEKFGDEYLK